MMAENMNNLLLESMSPERTKNANAKSITMDIKLAQASSLCGGILSPEFFYKNFEDSSSASSRDGNSSSEMTPNSYFPLGVTNSIPGISVQAHKQAFHFPVVGEKNEQLCDKINQPDTLPENLQIVEIGDDEEDEWDELHWLKLPKSYVEEDGYRVGIQPGDFYKTRSGNITYVKLRHRTRYKVLVTNNNGSSCDLDLYVDGKLVSALRLQAAETRLIYGPSYSKFAFSFIRCKDTSDPAVKGSDNMLGVVRAVFTPQKMKNLQENAEFKTLGEQDNIVRSVDRKIMKGMTVLRGWKKEEHSILATDMERDTSKRITLQLKLVSSAIEEAAVSEENIFCAEPPPLPFM